jgi:hypothetical protein
MAGISKVVVVQRDRRAGQAIRLGFEREGTEVVMADGADDAASAVAGAGLVVAGAGSSDEAAALLGRLTAARAAAGGDVPVLYVGNGASRRQALDAGADEVLPAPAFVRDVVTVGKLLAGTRPPARAHAHGDLGDTYGAFYLVRALAATGRSGVLSLVRGLRRGEVRFFEGEVTSAAVGGLHGQAALHQLLLWTEARFELRWEDVVRRGQIPLPRDELLRDAERFLHDLREVAGSLSPAAVYEQDPQRLGALAKKIPTEVHGVLRLFDGQRTVADVIEDCPFRVFETLRVAQRAAEVGLLRRVRIARPRSAARAVLPVEEWLVGSDESGGSAVPTQPIVDAGSRKQTTGGHQAQGAQSGQGKKGKKRKRTLHGVPSAAPGAMSSASATALPADIDWAPLVPRSTGADLAGLSGVVPSSKAAGEIVVGEIRARRSTAERMVAGSVEPSSATSSPSLPGHSAPAIGAGLAEAAGAMIAVTGAVPTAAPDAPTQKVVPDAAVLQTINDAPTERTPPRFPPGDDDGSDFDEPTPTVPLQPVVVEAMRRRSRAPSPRDFAEAYGELPSRRAGSPTSPPTDRVIDDGPSILVEDLGAAQAAMRAAASKAAVAAPAPARDASAAQPAASAAVDATRSAAVAAALAAMHFTEDEEAFFAVGASETFGHDEPYESFDDLDIGYQPVGLWERIMALLFPRRARRPSPATRAARTRR